MSTKHYEEGETCPECGNGTLQFEEPESCSCHISAPCNAHLDAPLVCAECGEEFAEEWAETPSPGKYVFDCYAYRYDVNSFAMAYAGIDFLYERDPFSPYGFGTPFPDDFGLLFFSHKTNPFDINFESLPHSTCTMIKRGWAPPWVTESEVHKKLDGTFGGRFRYFHKSGQFEFIAYTD